MREGLIERGVVTVEGERLVVQAGAFVKPDGWRIGSTLVSLGWREGVGLPSNNIQGYTHPCEVVVTGEVPRRVMGEKGLWLRVRIAYAGETAAMAGGWLALNQ